jgi:hypothetical protein
MADLIESLGLAPSIANAGLSSTSDFESLYDEIATSGKAADLKAELGAKQSHTSGPRFTSLEGKK